jgi:RNA polymerase sigma factor (sigma-70 family)
MHETLPVTQWASSLDDPAFQKLVQAYRPMLYSIALSLWDQRLNSRFDPSDAIQETWATLASVKHSVAFANRQQLCVYLKNTLLSRIHDAKRKWILAQKRSTDSEWQRKDPSQALAKSLRTEFRSPDNMLCNAEQVAVLMHAFLKLPEELQVLLKWRFEFEESYVQIAQRLERTPDTVRYLIRKCIDQVRDDLRIQCPEFFE